MSENTVYLRTQDVLLSELVPYPGNAKRGDVPKIQQSIAHHGQYRSLVVRHTPDDQLVILAGNHTAQALQAQGYVTARCEIIACDDETAAKINLVDNKAAESGDYDTRALSAILSGLNGDLAGTGFDESEVQALLGAAVPDPLLITPDPAPAPAAPRAESGPKAHKQRCPECGHRW